MLDVSVKEKTVLVRNKMHTFAYEITKPALIFLEYYRDFNLYIVNLPQTYRHFLFTQCTWAKVIGYSGQTKNAN